MSSDEPTGVVFPRAADGRRSTSALGRAVVADALRRVDAAAARDAEREHDWRRGYPRHFRRLIEACGSSPITNHQSPITPLACCILSPSHRKLLP